LFVQPERREDLGELIPLRAVETRRVSPVAVKLDDLLVGDAGALMQAVDVLSDDARDFSLLDQMRDRAVTAIRLCLCHGLVNGNLSTPRLTPRFFGRHELTKVDWLILAPEPTRAAKVRYSGFCADTCAGEGYGSFALNDQLAQIFYQ